MGAEGNHRTAMAALSTLDWWRVAGLDTLVEDRPRDWLRAAASRTSAPASAPAIAPAAAAAPQSLDALVARFMADDALAPGVPAAGRVAPAGVPGALLMVLLDMPEDEDIAAGHLLAGPCGRLLGRMLAAIGLGGDGESYRATVSPARFPAARIPRELTATLGANAIRHVALARPRLVLALGDAASCALGGGPVPAARGRARDLNHGEGSVPVIASFHPRILLQRPALKAESWRDLRLVQEGLR